MLAQAKRSVFRVMADKIRPEIPPVDIADVRLTVFFV